MARSLSSYIMNIIPDLIALIVLMLSFYNNPYRLSNEKNFINVAHYKMTFTIYFLIITLQLLIVYCKSFTYLNFTKFQSIVLPFILIFVPFAGFLTASFISNKLFIFRVDNSGNRIYTDETSLYENTDSKDISSNSYIDNNTYSSPPNYFFSKKIRLLIFYTCLFLVLINLAVFVKYFNNSKQIFYSPLQNLLTRKPESKIARNIILIIFSILIFLKLFLIYQQMVYRPCSLGLPDSWDI